MLALDPVGQTRRVPDPRAEPDPATRLDVAPARPRDLRAVTRRLERAGCVAASDEAAELLAAAADGAELDRLVARREQGEPLPWITGTTRFAGTTLRVDPGVYVPRAQTEELARRAAARLPAGGRALDLCTGTGAVAAHLQATVPDAMVVGIDLDERAARCARRNRVRAVVGDLAAPVADPGGDATFDVVTAVAPYVPTGELRLLAPDVQRWEPRVALDGGTDGLDLVRAVVVAAAQLLRTGGWVLVEVGGAQLATLAPTLAGLGFVDVTPWHDGDGDLRGIAARRAD